MNNGFFSKLVGQQLKNINYAQWQGDWPLLSNLGNLFKVAVKSVPMPVQNALSWAQGENHKPWGENAPPWPPVPGQQWPPATYNPNNVNMPLGQYAPLPAPNPNALNFRNLLGLKPVQGYSFQPYQVKSGDTFDAIAKNTGFTVEQVQQANNGMLVPPPNGSYINLPKATTTYGPPQILDTPGGYSPNSFTNAASQVDTAELVPALVNQLTGGALPPIPSQAQGKLINPQTGQPITDSELQQMGYNYDNQSKTWRNSAAEPQLTQPVGNGAFAHIKAVQQYAAQGTPFLEQKRWDPDTNKYVKIGDLLRQGKLDLQGNTIRRKEKKAKKQGTATNAGGTPSQGINTNTAGG